MARAGRRPGQTETRERILSAARSLFGRRGYEGTTVRAIAAEAEVNPALVHHFFGTKERVFVVALNLPIDPAVIVPRILTGPRQELGRRMVRTMLDVWGDPDSRQSFLALLRSVTTRDEAARMLRQLMEHTVLDRLADALEVPRLRLAAAAAHVVGLALLRYVIGMEPLADADEAEIVELMAPVIQYYVDGSAP